MSQEMEVPQGQVHEGEKEGERGGEKERVSGKDREEMEDALIVAVCGQSVPVRHHIGVVQGQN